MPASVSLPSLAVRSNSRSPSSSSSRRTAWLTAGWVRWSRAAALEKLRSVATVTKHLEFGQFHGGPARWLVVAARDCDGNGPLSHLRLIIAVQNINLTTAASTRRLPGAVRTGRSCTPWPISPTSQIFDTTLRDGEQAPGFSHADQTRRSAWPCSSTRLAWTSSKPASRSRRPLMPKRCGWLQPRSGARSSPRWRALSPARHRMRRRGARAGGASAHPHVHRDVRPAPRAQAAHDAARLVSTRRSTPSAVARQFTDDVEFSAEDATRSDLDFLCRVVEAVIDAGATTVNLPDTVGYSTPEEIEEFFRGDHRSRAERRQGRVQHALPRRSRTGRRQQPGGGARRRTPDRMHGQRHRRARRQRVARGDRDAVARAARSCAVPTRRSSRAHLRRAASC